MSVCAKIIRRRRQPLNSSVMRQLTTTIALLALSAASQAECLPQICYAVSFDIADCHLSRDERPTHNGEVITTVLTTHQVSARAVGCSIGSAVPTKGKPSLDQIQKQKSFSYVARSCTGLIGQSVTLFLPEVYFHDYDAAKCPIRNSMPTGLAGVGAMTARRVRITIRSTRP